MSEGRGTTNHEVFARLGEAEVSIGRIETELGSLGRQFSSLANSVDNKVGALQSMIHSIDSKLGGVGKISGAQFAGLAASLVGAVAVLGSVFVAPLTRDISALKETVTFSNTIGEKAIDDLGAKLYQHSQLKAHPEQAEQSARLNERVDNMRMAIAELDHKLQIEMKGQHDLVKADVDATKELLRAEMDAKLSRAWDRFWELKVGELQGRRP